MGSGRVVAAAIAGAAIIAGTIAAAPPQVRWAHPFFGGRLGADGWASELRTVDLNGDGLRDVVVTQNFWGSDETVPVQILLNKGGGRFVLATASLFDGPPTATQLARKIVVADFNADNRPDLFFADTGPSTELPDDPRHGHQNELALSTASGKLVDATANLPKHADFSHSAAAADIDGNGTVDIFVGNFNCCGDKTPPLILLNDGTGHFRDVRERLPDVPLAYGINFAYTTSEFADVNGDGSPDLLLGGMENFPRSVVLLNDGRGTFHYFADLPPHLYANGSVMDFAPVDLNGDGAADLISVETPFNPYYVGTLIQVLINEGDGRFRDETSARLSQQTGAKSWADRILVEDFNDDGKPDFALQYAPPGKVAVPDPTPFYLNRGDGTFTQITGAKQGAPPDERGPVGFVNGAGPHAVVSVATHEGVLASYYVTPQLVTLEAPTGVATSSVRSGVRITWKPVAGATAYELWRSGVRLARTTRTTFVDTTAKPRRLYRYAVRGVQFGEPGPLSRAVAGKRR
jgi:hypothetical protein